MSDDRKPNWIGIGILSVVFGAALIALTSARVTEAGQMIGMIVIVVLFYVLLGLLANWRVEDRAESASRPTPRISTPTESPGVRHVKQPYPQWSGIHTTTSNAKVIRYEEN